jgi:peptidyl-prolyl cis-trans isomerase C
MRLVFPTAAALVVLSGAALAQSPKTVAAKSSAGDPVVATVNGEAIRMSDMNVAAESLPPQARQLPQNILYPKLLDQMVARKALLLQAKKLGLDHDPAVQKQMQAAADNVLQGALLQKEVLPKLSEDAIKAKYDADIAGKPGETQVHARHILVDSEAKAKDIIAQLNKGAKFEDLAKKYGDPKDAATQQGGDLGFFKKGDMLPEFSNAAFALKPNEITQTPVHTRYGWHVIQVLEVKTAQPPTYDQAHDQIKQALVQSNIQAAVAQARAAVKITEYNSDGTPVKPGEEPSAPAPAAAPASPPSGN